MKAKLIKTEDGYALSIPNESTNKFIASTDGMYVDNKLSLKNCEAIANCNHLSTSEKEEHWLTFTQSLQQTEWEVEIITSCKIGCTRLILNGQNSMCCGDVTPKLDSNGCLILKRL